MKVEARNKFLFIFLIIAACFLCFHSVLFNLNSTLLSDGGDGMKNYFTYLYFIGEGSGSKFTGMNYPFGEHIIFTDNIPFLAWSLSTLKIYMPGIEKYALLIMHSVMILSFVLSAIYIKKIVEFFGVKGWFAIVAAVFISFFSPQVLRTGAHFSLSMACFIPMLFLWILKFEQERKSIFLFYIALATTIFTFIHVYFLAMGLVFVSAYCLSYFITHKGKIVAKLKFTLALSLSVIVPILFFKTFLLATDSIKDRPRFPFSFLGACTTGEDILTSDFNFIGANIFKPLFGRASNGSEGYTYLGVIAIIIALFMIYRIVKSLVIKLKKKIKIPAHPIRAYRTWLLTSFLVLLFAMGVPFVWFEWMIDYFSTFRQFRAIGRFSWIFYNIMAVYGIIVLYRGYYFIKRRYNKKPSIYLNASVVIVLLVFAIELNGYAQYLHKLHKDGPSRYQEYFNQKDGRWDIWLQSKGVDYSKFQASIGFPYFHVGSEKIDIFRGRSATFYIGSQIAMHTKIAMTNVMMSRTSWSQTFDQLLLYDGPFTPKPTFKLYNNKPFLLFINTQEELTFGEKWLLGLATPIGNKSGFDIYELNLNRLTEVNKHYTDSLVNIVKSKSAKEGFLSVDSGFNYSIHFDEGQSGIGIAGTNAHEPIIENWEHFATIPIENNTDDTNFIFSTWFKCFLDSDYMPYVIYQQFDDKGLKIAEGDYLSWDGSCVLSGWFLAERVIVIKKQTQSIKLSVIGGSKKYIAMDELLIRPKNSLYYYKANDSTYLLNNRPVKVTK